MDQGQKIRAYVHIQPLHGQTNWAVLLVSCCLSFRADDASISFKRKEKYIERCHRNNVFFIILCYDVGSVWCRLA